jgi:hypothetical protein
LEKEDDGRAVRSRCRWGRTGGFLSGLLLGEGRVEHAADRPSGVSKGQDLRGWPDAARGLRGSVDGPRRLARGAASRQVHWVLHLYAYRLLAAERPAHPARPQRLRRQARGDRCQAAGARCLGRRRAPYRGQGHRRREIGIRLGDGPRGRCRGRRRAIRSPPGRRSRRDRWLCRQRDEGTPERRGQKTILPQRGGT